MEDVEFELKSELEDCRTQCHLLEMTVKNLERENQQLKEQIKYLALENSNELCDRKNQKYSKTEAKWKYYHTNKFAIKAELEKDDTKVTWVIVKRESDLRFSKENSLTKDK